MAVQSRRVDLDAPDRRSETVVRLLTCPDPQTLLTAVIEAAQEEVDASAVTIHLLQDDGGLRLATATGLDERLEERLRILPADGGLPLNIVARERRPVFESAESLRERFRDIAELRAPAGFAVFPLLTGDKCLGMMGLRLDSGRSPSVRENSTLSMIVSVCAHRLDHLLSTEDEVFPAAGRQFDQAVRFVEGRTRAARLDLALSSADMGSFDWDLSSGQVVWDERLGRIYGLQHDDYERIESIFDAIHPEDRPQIEEAVRQSYGTGECNVVHRIVRPDGTIRWLDSKGTLFFDPVGRPQAMVGISQDRTEAIQAEMNRTSRREFVLAVTAAFSKALSTQDVVDAATGDVLPGLEAQALALYLEGKDGLSLAGSAGYRTADEAMLRSAELLGEGGLLRGLCEEGTPKLIENREDYLKAFPDPALQLAADHQAWAMLPLSTAEGRVGACVISWGRQHTFSSDDDMVYAAISSILAQSLARSRRFDESRRQMTDLQRMMLPQSVPELSGVDLAVRYLPGTGGMEVGGDWYDVLPLAGERVGLLIGDVQGHSAEAAAVMGQLRTALRVYADEGHSTASLLRRGNRMLCGLDTELFATCCVVELDPRDGVVRMARAGHPYPMLVEPDGSVCQLDEAGGLPLGLDPAEGYSVVEAELRPGATLLLYTDGLVEHRGQSYSAAVDVIGKVLAGEDRAGGGVAALERLADRIIAPAVTRGAMDDIAVLLVRRPG
ncbi:SpoIIE family protein phosphatase [Streptomyces sp. TP-A0874]|uniref:SpoIIE family protein phosphatase n=1 Tax=Streptomyces sp. TP-A0874 TaxID=549819 RepID=UPI000852CAA3|nr:SpoIIE family protein phosphatase [Streptomyces sp. TP-A0874]